MPEVSWFPPKNWQQLPFSPSSMPRGPWTRRGTCVLSQNLARRTREPSLGFHIRQTPTLGLRHRFRNFPAPPPPPPQISAVICLLHNALDSVERRGNSNPAAWAGPCEPASKTAKNILCFLSSLALEISQLLFFVLFVTAETLELHTTLPETRVCQECQQQEAAGGRN